jgi:hypothetical protein
MVVLFFAYVTIATGGICLTDSDILVPEKLPTIQNHEKGSWAWWNTSVIPPLILNTDKLQYFVSNKLRAGDVA